MSLIVFHTKKIREALALPESMMADLLVLLALGGLVGVALMVGRQVSAPMVAKVQINLSLWSLPKYTLLTLTRGFMAYAISLLFTLVYGTIMAHSRRAERFMLPVLDVLQSIPVLSFLPGVVLAMIALFPTREIGLEIACVIMLFTGQAWNMTFSYYGSVRNIPPALKEASKIYRMGWWRNFSILELPAAMIGLVWNSMMSMAGGWFTITVVEAFTLGDQDFRLPGLGSYMNEANSHFQFSVWETWKPIIGATIAMVIMIVAVDQLFWRPIVAWSERFKLEDTADAEKPQSWLLNLLAHSKLINWANQLFKHKDPVSVVDPSATPTNSPVQVISEAGVPNVLKSTKKGVWGSVFAWGVIVIIVVLAVRGAWIMFELLTALPLYQPSTHEDWATVLGSLFVSFLRTTAAIIIGAAWTLPVGIFIGLSPKWSQRLQPVVQVVASYPAPMVFPLVALGLAAMKIPFNIGCVVLMLMGTQWYILFNVIAGAMAIPGDLKEVGLLYRTSTYQKWTRLYIPCVFPYLVTGLVTASGGAWNATIVSEYVQGAGQSTDVVATAPASESQPALVTTGPATAAAGDQLAGAATVTPQSPDSSGSQTYVAYGLGAVISQASAQKNFPLLAAATSAMALTVVLLNHFIWKRLYRRAEERYSLVT